jgi:release factor glutamine methyltransferase
MVLSSREFLHTIANQLAPLYKNYDVAFATALLLVEKLTGTSRSDILSSTTITVSHQQQTLLDDWLERLIVHHYPLQYLLETVQFLDLTLEISPPTLIPRPETEWWCDLLITRLTSLGQSLPLSILDLCTGSGCIGLALAQALPHATIDAIDKAPSALALCQKNKQLNSISNLTCVSSDLYAQLNQQQAYDVIVANPPYIAPNEFCNLDPSVRLWEDSDALVAADHGLYLIKKIVDKAPLFLRNLYGAPQMWIEIGYQQGPVVRKIFQDRGFCNVQVLKDDHGQDRVVIGYGYAQGATNPVTS